LKELLRALTSRQSAERRRVICDWLNRWQFDFEVERFTSGNLRGANIYVPPEQEMQKVVVLSAHYDGPGAYDNAGGVAALLLFLKNCRLETRPISFSTCFFDLEESFQAGSRHFCTTRTRDGLIERAALISHIEIDGCGIGDRLVRFHNVRHLRLHRGRHFLDVPFTGDSLEFQNIGIPSLRLTTLPLREATILIRKKVFPPTWLLLHTARDRLSLISPETLHRTAAELGPLVTRPQRAKKASIVLHSSDWRSNA